MEKGRRCILRKSLARLRDASSGPETGEAPEEVSGDCKSGGVQLATLPTLHSRKLQPGVPNEGLLSGPEGASAEREGNKTSQPLPSPHPHQESRRRPAAPADLQGREQRNR